VPTVIYTDHKLGKTFLYDEEDDQSRINQILNDINTLESAPSEPIKGMIQEEKEEKFIEGVKSSLDYIFAGDVFR
jgi:anthranilate/para-aminobenzoate synthase component I